ncbi:MAG: UDP-N-acetylmuramate dehydrogenase [Gammaproteobacteria bacterium]|nr:MAG: UDP-N-acetylmuramate dehydrogenase [Gammaproteobacteria bacterium]
MQKNFTLKNLNTLDIDVIAEQYVLVNKQDELSALLSQIDNEKMLVLGGGSNYLFVPGRLRGLVLHIAVKGREIIEQGDDFVVVRAMAGEPWHDFVLWTLDQGFGGLENLSLIPGSVGAAPVQNIGAYGVEVKDSLVELEAMNRQTGEIRLFATHECAFGYRDSIFKSVQRDQWIILSVSFRLSRKAHQLHLDYGAIRQILEQRQIKNPTIMDISDAVIAIRRQRLPDPKVLPNAGSFFKNPVVQSSTFDQLKDIHPQMPGFKLSDEQIKIPAGWLIEQCGWKGRRHGSCGVHDKHALVLVNYAGASGADIWNLAQQIQHSVQDRFGIQLIPEVNVVTQD